MGYHRETQQYVVCSTNVCFNLQKTLSSNIVSLAENLPRTEMNIAWIWTEESLLADSKCEIEYMHAHTQSYAHTHMTQADWSQSILRCIEQGMISWCFIQTENITPYCPIQPLYNPYMVGICWYMSGVLSEGYPTFPLWFSVSVWPRAALPAAGNPGLL